MLLAWVALLAAACAPAQHPLNADLLYEAARNETG